MKLATLEMVVQELEDTMRAIDSHETPVLSITARIGTPGDATDVKLDFEHNVIVQQQRG